MSIKYWVDHERRFVMLKFLDNLTVGDVFAYKQDVGSRPELAGYDELADLSGVERIVGTSITPLMEVARLAADMDVGSPSAKVAIFAPTDLVFGLGRLYMAHRNMVDTATKEVEVFRSLEDAIKFLGINGPLPDEGGLAVALSGNPSDHS
jgi:hypothetical protein